MFRHLHSLFAGTLRRQLIFGMVLVVSTMMSLFVWDQTRRQQTILLEQQSDQAVGLARSVATSAAVWVAAQDYTGLQEIVTSLAPYPDLRHAIVLDSRGLILAHSTPARRGQYLVDLPKEAEPKVLQRGSTLVDVVSPVTLAGKHIGWVRIGLSGHSLDAKLAGVTQNGMVYTMVAIVLIALLAEWVGRYLTRRLYAIQRVAIAVQAGESARRAEVAGNDEAAQLARQFNSMLDTIVRREQEIVSARDALLQSESRLQHVMAITGEGIWDWDIAKDCVRHNASWCEILGLDGRRPDYKIADYTARLHEDDRVTAMACLQACLAGKGKYASEHRVRLGDGRIIWVQDRADVVERDGEGKPLRMIGSVVDITERKQAEENTVRQLCLSWGSTNEEVG
ncbi:MAG: PAS domain-containing protein [Magnetococcales bacterium]|nr:PAS domain-containing protein [Magnetococcales bacterium]